MTKREACEQIVADGTCVGVLCGNCPLFEGDWDCTDMDEVTLAEMWLRLHPCEKKLVDTLEDMLKQQKSEHMRIKNEEHPMYDLVKEHVQNILRAIDPIREDNTRRYIDCQVTMIVRKLKGIDCTGMEEDCAKYERRIALEDYE
jgi:hypothetical protein